MIYIFLDESGDLGFDFKKKGTSKFFLVAIILSKDSGVLDKIVKKVFKGFSKKELENHTGVLHSYKEDLKTRKKLLRLVINNKDLKIFVIYVNKSKLKTNMRSKKHTLYNHIVSILLGYIYDEKLIVNNEVINMFISRRETNKTLNLNFIKYIRDQSMKNHKLNLELSISHPSTNKGLQVVDMISWAMFRKYEHGDEVYFILIKEKVVEINYVFLGKTKP